MNSYKWALFTVFVLLLSFGLAISACDSDHDDDDDNDDNPLDYDDNDDDDDENEFRNSMCNTIAWSAFICDQDLDADSFYEQCIEDSWFDCLLGCYYDWWDEDVSCEIFTSCLEDCIN